MDALTIGIVLGLLLAALLATGVWIALSLFIVALAGMVFFTGAPAGLVMATNVWSSIASWSLAPLPMFVWMGEILFRSRLSSDLFNGLAPWLGRLPGRLLHVNILGCGIFAAVSGSSAATVATVGRMAIPELQARRYPERMILGTLAGSGTLGLLIPPSIILIVYGVTAEQSIARLFMAGLLPGIVLIALFMVVLGGWSLVRRLDVEPEAQMSLTQRLRTTARLVPVLGLIIAVIGSIYIGLATPTEAAAFGVAGALIVSGLMGTLTWQSFRDSLIAATRTSAMIIFILAGAAFLTVAAGYTGVPRALAAWIAELQLPATGLLIALALFFIVMGLFLDGISVVVLTSSIILPMVRQAGIDPIWFGIFLVITVEMAQITPPVGFNLFVLQGLTGRNIFAVAYAAIPFFLTLVAMVALLMIFPELATWLPEQMNRPATP